MTVHRRSTGGQSPGSTRAISLLCQVYLVDTTCKWHIGTPGWVRGVWTPLLSYIGWGVDGMLAHVYRRVGRLAWIQACLQVTRSCSDVISEYRVYCISTHVAAPVLVPLTHTLGRSFFPVHLPSTGGQCCKAAMAITLLGQVYLVDTTCKWHIGTPGWVRGYENLICHFFGCGVNGMLAHLFS